MDEKLLTHDIDGIPVTQMKILSIETLYQRKRRIVDKNVQATFGTANQNFSETVYKGCRVLIGCEISSCRVSIG